MSLEAVCAITSCKKTNKSYMHVTYSNDNDVTSIQRAGFASRSMVFGKNYRKGPFHQRDSEESS